jgi:hypothetical protein
MSDAKLSTKRLLIDKANTMVVIITSAACFVVVFSLVASHALVSQLSYQNRIIKTKRQTVSQLKSNITAVSSLDTAYEAFVSTPTNVLGGSPTGSGSKDGDNGKIVLDALPSEYDFPALATSLEALLSNQGVQIQSIGGSDQEVAQSSTTAMAAPQPVAMPFTIAVSGNYQGIQNVINQLDRSIRPMQIQTMNLSGDQANLTLNVTAQTFYQPAKKLGITTEVVK